MNQTPNLRATTGRPAPIFILGSGRSGTHWLGHILRSHPAVTVTIEERPMFGWSTAMALDSRTREVLFPKLAREYRIRIDSSAGHYADKSHPNIWIAEMLAGEFPDALFVGIERGPFATVASMLRHGGVLSWHRRWREFPVPNTFLGITEADASGYDDLGKATQCAMRWVTHRDRMRTLRERLGSRLMVLSYEAIHSDPKREATRLQRFLGLAEPFPVPEVRTGSLDKWREELSGEEIEQIAAVVGSIAIFG